MHRFSGAAAEFHGRPIAGEAAVEVWSFEVDRPALVLGSRQTLDLVDVAACEAEGVDVVHRRSGGGVVLVEPGAMVWVDVVVRPHSSWWTDDVVEALIKYGRAWAEAIAGTGATPPLEVYRGRLQRGHVAEVVCFAGLGAGEVVDASGAKLVGLSQRRTRHGARLQGAVHRRWNPARLHRLLAPGLVTADELEALAVGALDVDRETLVDALAGVLADVVARASA